jgi:branched-subunit amino acid transport protein AzlD
MTEKLNTTIGILSILTLINTFISSAVSNISSATSSILGLIHLAGIDTFLSITLGALVTRATIQSAQVSLSKLTNT